MRCGHCGAGLPAGTVRCPACGHPIAAPPPGPAAATSAPVSDPVFRTRISLLLIAIGVVVQLAPAGPLLATAFLLLGGSLLIASSEPFGDRHARNATVGLVLAIAGLLGGYVYALAFPLAIAAAPASPALLPGWIQSLEAALSQALLVAAAFASVSALGLVLVTYSLQDRTGRLCLWAACGLVVAVNLLAYWVLSQEMTTLLNEASAGQGLDAALLNTIATQLTQFAYLTLVPQAVFAACYFLADARIRRGLVPTPPAGTSA